MKRSSSVPEMTLGPSSSSSSSSTTVGFPPGPASLKSQRGISSSQISLPGDLARPSPLSSCTMDTSTAWRAPPFSPIPMSRLNSPTSRPHRVEQLKKEECIDERQSEKEVMEINNLNQSYEELTVVRKYPAPPRYDGAISYYHMWCRIRWTRWICGLLDPLPLTNHLSSLPPLP
jgi:hypothetical protein